MAIENCHLYWIFPLNMVIFHSYVSHNQRVHIFLQVTPTHRIGTLDQVSEHASPLLPKTRVCDCPEVELALDTWRFWCRFWIHLGLDIRHLSPSWDITDITIMGLAISFIRNSPHRCSESDMCVFYTFTV